MVPLVRTGALELVVRKRGWRWPFRVGDGVEVWRDGECLGEIGVDLLLHLLTHHLQGVALTEALRHTLLTQNAPPPMVAPRPKRDLANTHGRKLRGRE